MNRLKKLDAPSELKKLNLLFDRKKNLLVNLPPGFCNVFLTQLDDNRYCAIITHKINMQTGDVVRREGKRQPDFTFDGPHLFIGPAEKLEEVKIISSTAIHGHWFVEAEGFFLSYFRRTDGIPDQPYDQYSFSEKNRIFHVIPPENI
ncbi:MAG TPA: hypothetical protein VMD74_05575, partial [Candidatus Methylomirabilis sp.]|nr:hypothetical protein [Candidatus Methylomirabilis sp.]